MAAITAAAIGVGTSLIGGAVGAHQASQAAKGARNDARRAKAEMDAIKEPKNEITFEANGVLVPVAAEATK